MSGFNDQASPASPDIFFRSVDRLQLESYLTALRQENKSLVLLSKHQVLLSYYSEIVFKRIHQEFPDTRLEVLLPGNTEGLLDRFNAILNSLSFEVATRPTAKEMPNEIWLIQNANALGENDIQILLKLIENFPGAGICAVLMFNASETDAPSVFENNPKVNTWLLSLPTPEQKLNAIQQARRNGAEEVATEFFNQLLKSEKISNQPQAKTSTDKSEKSTPQKPSVPAPKLESKQKNNVAAKKNFLPWVVIVSGLLSISVGVSAVLHPEFGDQILNAFIPKGKNLKAVSAEDPSTFSKASSSNKASAEIPEIATQGQKWLMTLPGDHFVLEFQTFPTAQEAQSEVEGKEWLKRAYVIPVRAEGSSDIKFLLVDGPFRTAEMAKKAASRMPNSSDIAIENVNELKGVTAGRR